MMGKIIIGLVVLVVLLAIFPSVGASSAPVGAYSSAYRIKQKILVINEGPGNAEDVNLMVCLPKTTNHQKVLHTTYSIQPTITVDDVDNNLIGTFSIGRITPNEIKSIEIEYDVVVRYDYFNIDVVTHDMPAGMNKFLQSTSDWEADDPLIRALAAQIEENTTTILEKVRSIIQWIINNIQYTEQLEEHSALWALKNRRGDCTEFSNLFVALSRAMGVPARGAFYFTYSEEIKGKLVEGYHRIAEVYLPNVGWAPVDLTWKGGLFGELPDGHIYVFTTSTRDSERTLVRIKYGVYAGQPEPRMTIDTTKSAIIKTAGISMTLSNISPTHDKILFDVAVVNKGTVTVKDISITIDADPRYFRAAKPEYIPKIAAGESQTVSFTIDVISTPPAEQEINIGANGRTSYGGEEVSPYAAASFKYIPLRYPWEETLYHTIIALVVLSMVAGIAIVVLKLRKKPEVKAIPYVR